MRFLNIFAFFLAMCMLLVGCKDTEKTDNTTQPATTQPTVETTQPQEKVPTHILERNGVRFELPMEFYDFSETKIGQDHGFLYGNDEMVIVGDKTKKDDGSIASLEQFAAWKASEYGAEAVQKDGFWTVTYEDPEANEPQTNICVFYETQDAFWVIRTYCPSQILDICQADMWRYATAAEFQK